MSIIKEQDFLSHLHELQNQNPPSIAILSHAKAIYDIDLIKRTVEAPKYLGVYKDHQAETIYFRVNRFHDYMDLSNTACVIQYTTPDRKDHLYVVPFYDIVSESRNNKMIFPWCVEGVATQYSGPINFSIRFFKTKQVVEVVDDYVDVENATETPTEIVYKLIYNLTTLPARSQVLNGIEAPELEDGEFSIGADVAEYLVDAVHTLQQREGVYWTILED